jgi:hypothetical protein
MFFMASAFILLPANAGLAQQAAGEGPTFHAGVALVKVDAQVVGHNGRVVPGLAREDFEVFDDGRPQKIAHFGQDAEVREPLTQDLHAVEEEMRDAVHTDSLGSGTSINAAIVTAAQYLQKQTARGRRAILIVTDNLSLNYRIPDEEVIHELYAADAVLNGMLIGKQKRPDPPKPGQYFNSDFTPSDIFKLAEQSGGEAMEAGKIGESFQHMIERIRARYSIQYAAPPSKPGQFHHIRVDLTPAARSRHRSSVIRARAGYYAAP